MFSKHITKKKLFFLTKIFHEVFQFFLVPITFLTSISAEVHDKDRVSLAGDNFPVWLIHHAYELHLKRNMMMMMNFRHCNHWSNILQDFSLAVFRCCLSVDSRYQMENFAQSSVLMIKVLKQQLCSISHSFLLDLTFAFFFR